MVPSPLHTLGGLAQDGTKWISQQQTVTDPAPACQRGGV
ncbi:predicted protein [Plenodomus lingam JN3]|uniref:Predicted protein n=1 Tax=Leptosphaeria maculans (strain JN3 / isolate v23.1.3 / race Av1-4-5-6-7-8) TaxID=985895 RepID=E4ZLH7_LEPMJ|nr:predicted protein [Plenodomus lingam JN3]CBX92336.1 predicted protein [Plenodomus lingam JN3]